MNTPTTQSSDAWDNLEAQLDAPEADRWKPENPGDRVVMLVSDITYRMTKAGRVLPIVAGTRRDGSPVEVAAGTTVIRNRLAESQVQAGDMLAMEFIGSKQSESGHEYFDYKIVVSKNGPRRPSDVFNPNAAPVDDLVPEATTVSADVQAAFGGSAWDDTQAVEDDPKF